MWLHFPSYLIEKICLVTSVVSPLTSSFLDSFCTTCNLHIAGTIINQPHFCFPWCQEQACLRITLWLTQVLLGDWAIRTLSPSKRGAVKLDFSWSQCLSPPFRGRDHNFPWLLFSVCGMPGFLRQLLEIAAPNPGLLFITMIFVFSSLTYK